MQSSAKKNTSTAAVLHLESDGRIRAVRGPVEELTGLAPETVTGVKFQDLFTPGGPLADLLPLCEAGLHGEASGSRPVRFLDERKGECRSLLATVLPLPSDTDDVSGAVLCLESAHPAFYLSSLALDSVADGIFTVDRNWTITSFNRAAETITGWSAERAIGRSCSEVFHSSMCGRNCPIAESLYSGRPVTNRSQTIRTGGGDRIPVSISAAPLVDPEGNIIGGIETFRDLSVLGTQHKRLTRRYQFEEMISKSKAMQRLFTIMPEIADSPSTVMIYGESGTGKEMVARAIYNLSDRRDKPFVAVNCGALPESLLESELFGYKAGAFTDARKDKEGRFAAAEGGTLFLDEIGEIPLHVQVKLLRVLQEKVYEPLGSNTQVETDVRIISATNRDLKAMVIEGTFREDLYYRLNVVRIQLPPLRERKEDIPLLIRQFITEFNSQMGKDIAGISNPALSRLMRHDFPGNIRELKNIIEYAFILCDGGYILPRHLPEPFDHEPEYGETPDSAGPDQTRTLEEIEKQAIFLALERNGWRKQKTADELGISKDTLRRKMIRYDLVSDELI
ncbi:MAG: sigma 54-interacting transcriptional regulator OrpR [Desulfobulbaceae bacterium]